ncbi:AEC family transporter [Siculibacillus lacustris]|uniref:AEC family transporter n=1 Tax=Siculibacillus lacustris TaxID=1549641 RepID=UPI0013F16B53|nr:AEC family transporter [Siculibacillus lacustris]
MLFAIEIVLPIFTLIAFGWTLAAVGVLGRTAGAGLAEFAAKVGLPVLIFKTIASAQMTADAPWMLWACYFPGAAIAWTAGHLFAGRVLRRDPPTAVIAGIASAFANTAFVGLPLAQRAYGEHGVLIVSLLLAVHMPIMMATATILMERAERQVKGGDGRSPLRVMLQILANVGRQPVVIGVICGTAFRLSGLVLPELVDKPIGMIAQASTPVMLFALGMSLWAHGVKGEVATAVAASVAKLALMPAAVLAIALALGLERSNIGPLVLIAALPTGINVHMIAIQFRSNERLASATVVMTTVVSVVTSSLWLMLLARFV